MIHSSGSRARIHPHHDGSGGNHRKGAPMNDYPSFDLTDRVALVTGAARGLGNAISLALAHAGAHVALGLRDVKTGGELAKPIEAMARKALPLQMDMTRLDHIPRAAEERAARFGRLNILR